MTRYRRPPTLLDSRAFEIVRRVIRHGWSGFECATNDNSDPEAA